MPTPTPAPARSLRIRSPGDLPWIARRHAGKGLLALALVGGLTAAAYFMLEQRYASEAKILVRLGRESVRLDPTASTGPTVGISETRRHEINSEVGILGSEDLLAALVAAVPGCTDGPHPIEKLKRRLHIAPQEESNIINVAFSHRDPAVARDTVAGLVALYIDKHIKVHTTKGSSAFFRKQAQQTTERLSALRKELQKKRRDSKVHTLEAQQTLLLERAAILTKERERTSFEIEVSQAQLTELQKRLVALEKSLDAEMNSNLKRALASNQQRLRLDIALEKTKLAGLRAKRHKLTDQFAGVDREVDSLQRREGEIRALREEVKLLDTKYQAYLDSLEQSRIDDELGYDKISNIRVVQAATMPSRPIGPGKIWILAVGIFAALVAAVIVVLFADYLDGSFQTSNDVERRLDTGVLAALRSHRGLRRLMARKANPKKPRPEPKLATDIDRELELLAGRVAALDERTRVVAVTGAKARVGTSTVAYHLAARIAKSGLGRVLLIDANVGKPAISRCLGIEQERRIKGTDVKDLCAVATRSHSDITRLLEQIESGRLFMDYVIIDLPSITQSLAAVTTAKLANGTIFVVDSKATDADSAERGLRILRDSDVEIFGAVLNQHSVPARRAA